MSSGECVKGEHPSKVRSKRRVVDLDEVMRLAAEGYGTSRICSKMKLDISTLMDRLKSSGMYEEYKEINAQNNKVRPKRTVVDIDRVMDLARKNNSKTRICHVLGIDKETLRDRLITAEKLEELDQLIAHRMDYIDDAVDEAIRIAPECRSVREAAERIGCSQSSLNNRLITRGMLEEFHNKKLRLKRTKVDIDEAFAIAPDCSSFTMAVKRLGTTTGTLCRILEEAGRYDEFIALFKPMPKSNNVRKKGNRAVKIKDCSYDVKKQSDVQIEADVLIQAKNEESLDLGIDIGQVMGFATEGMTIGEVASICDIDSTMLRSHLLKCGKYKEFVETSRSIRFQEAKA